MPLLGLLGWVRAFCRQTPPHPNPLPRERGGEGKVSAMARAQNSFVCQSCGAAHSKWSGRCDACGGWNMIVEEAASVPIGGGGNARRSKGRPIALEDLQTADELPPRRTTGLGEFDRVCGGGLVPGSALLI